MQSTNRTSMTLALLLTLLFASPAIAIDFDDLEYGKTYQVTRTQQLQYCDDSGRSTTPAIDSYLQIRSLSLESKKQKTMKIEVIFYIDGDRSTCLKYTMAAKYGKQYKYEEHVDENRRLPFLAEATDDIVANQEQLTEY